MTLAVVGGRDFRDMDLMFSTLDKIYARRPDLTIVSGGARGADSLAVAWARLRDVDYREHIPEWDKHGKYLAPKIRNQEIIDDADACLAFWNGVSGGTRDAIDRAEAKGIPVKIIRYK